MAKSDLRDLDAAVWLRRDALNDGLSNKAVNRLVSSGEWHRVRRGAYTSGELWQSLSPEDQHRVRCRAALRTAHPSSVLSHVSSAVEWGADTWDIDLGEVHLTRTDGKAGRREAGVAHHRGVLAEADVAVVNGVRVTKAARAVVETCTIADVEPALVVANSLLHLGPVRMLELEAEAQAAKFWPGTLATDVVLRLADARVESVAETRFFVLCRNQQLPRPVPQVDIHDESGALLGRVDFAWPELAAFAEIDGRQKYVSHRRPNESLDEFLLREKRREELICQVTGWVCIRITWADLARPQLLARRIRKILEARQRALHVGA